ACEVARQSLQPFLDGELGVGDQIAVAAHLEWCPECADALADMRTIRRVLRARGSGYAPLSREEAAGFQAGVRAPTRAESESSLFARVRGLFDDLHFVYAGLGGVAALLLCGVVTLGTMQYATSQRPDSLAAVVAFLATPGASADVASIDGESHARWQARFS